MSGLGESRDLFRAITEDRTVDIVVMLTQAAGWGMNTARRMRHLPEHTGILVGSGFGMRHGLEKAPRPQVRILVGSRGGQHRTGCDPVCLQVLSHLTRAKLPRPRPPGRH